ncbi:GGDEF domain-containing protein [Clostridium sp. C2-6-12]|uniref:GGDEF domain-containing protein n=1 Tax=Clostridium sp. C2-6-12 TaxID=2698832 RepID=UPI00136B7B13|nr:GGDEF domain-containing protein [Clostridium sp. C2-6-12]
MKIKSSLNLTLNEEDSFRNETIKINIRRGRIYSKYIIFAEIMLCLTDTILNYNKHVNDFKFNTYFFMYFLMIGINFLYLFCLKNTKVCLRNLKMMEFITTSYIIFMMVWGAIISLMDQKTYGQIMVYMLNLIACSVIYYIDSRRLISAYFISTWVLFFGLPYFQSSSDIILGHYINSIIFIICAYVVSRTLYKNLYINFRGKNLVIEANEKLKREISENKTMYKKLQEANKKLKKLSLKDELTNLNNRRALREFIENLFKYEKKETPVSIIMIDIDNFKSYNDKYGHVNGDEVLRKVSCKLNETLRGSRDFVGRYGGEEFVYIALQTDEREIYEIAKEIKEKIYNLKIIHEYSEVCEYVTASLGVATIVPDNIEAVYECIRNADISLYQAKIQGKNKIMHY